MLSKKSKYAINALVYLARRFQKGPVLISQIAQSEKIPQKFLEAILLDLKNNGILNSKKGKGGGYYLSKNPEDVNVADIIRLFDGPIALLPCVTHKYYQKCEECEDEENCGIHDLFQQVRRETVRTLKAGTLSDILKRETKLKNTP
ncbi:Rrf2 family transcriptional regulator [soil metagenome]